MESQPRSELNFAVDSALLSATNLPISLARAETALRSMPLADRHKTLYRQEAYSDGFFNLLDKKARDVEQAQVRARSLCYRPIAAQV